MFLFKVQKTNRASKTKQKRTHKNQLSITMVKKKELDLLWSFCNIYTCQITMLYTWSYCNIMLYVNYTSIKKQVFTTASYLVWPSNCLRGALPVMSKSWTPPSSLPATSSLPSCRKVAQYAVSLNREKVFIGSWEYRP